MAIIPFALVAWSPKSPIQLLIPLSTGITMMGHYSRGDIVIATIAMDPRSGTKTRPALVIGTGEYHIFLCPISSRPPTDAPSLPVSLDDFSEGGLDLFGESYVLVSRVLKIHSSGIIGKKGHLNEETIDAVMSLVDRSPVSDHSGTKNPRRPTGAGK